MPEPIVRFERAFEALIPDEGEYQALVASVREHTSERGNATIQVVYELSDVDPVWDRVSEYFVVSCPNNRAVAISQRRLLSLCRACGLRPRPDEDVDLSELVGCHLDLRLGHETYDGRLRLRVVGHRCRP
jgi:hypothetical protein